MDYLVEMDRLCVPEDEKIEVMFQFLRNNTNKSVEFIEGVGIIWNNQINPNVIVVSHLDVNPNFKKYFEDNGKFMMGENGNRLVGPLDNLAANAIVMDLLRPESGLPEDVMVVFTVEEECGFGGMRRFIESRDDLDSSYFINTDMTFGSESQESAIIEIDDRTDKGLKIRGAVRSYAKENDTCGYTLHREGDDVNAILRSGQSGFSLCLPISGGMHGIHTSVRYELLDGYRTHLKEIISVVKDRNASLAIF